MLRDYRRQNKTLPSVLQVGGFFDFIQRQRDLSRRIPWLKWQTLISCGEIAAPVSFSTFHNDDTASALAANAVLLAPLGNKT